MKFTYIVFSSFSHFQTEELKILVGEDHINWVAQYLVMKRASIEPNFHNLYISFMDTLGSTALKKTVLRETYRNIKVREIVEISQLFL